MFCTTPSAEMSTPFQTIISMKSRLPRFSSEWRTASIAVSAGTNHSTTLKCSTRSTQNGSSGTGGRGSAPARIAS